jgi:DNA-binding response OmpR family regulator
LLANAATAALVVLTAAASAAQRAAEVGAEGYVGKPFDLDELLQVVRTQLGQEGGRGRGQAWCEK